MKKSAIVRGTVVITGADGGMGQACCERLSREGWHLVGIDRFSEGSGHLPKDMTAIQADVRAPDLLQQLDKVLDKLPAPVGLVNLVGASVGDTIEQVSDEDWQASLDINLTPAMRLIRFLAPRMTEGGSIINVGSPVGIIGARKVSYAASKAALQGLTMAVARNLGGRNIRANLLLPGPTITGMTNDWASSKREAIARGTFLGRLCSANEIAGVIAFLLGPDSSYMTGSIVDLTGGSMYGH